MLGVSSHLRAALQIHAVAALLGLAQASCFGKVSDEPRGQATSPVSPPPSGAGEPDIGSDGSSGSMDPQGAASPASPPAIGSPPPTGDATPPCSCSASAPFIELDRAGQLTTFTLAPQKPPGSLSINCLPAGPFAVRSACGKRLNLVGCNPAGCLAVSGEPDGAGARLTWLQDASNTLLQVSGGQLDFTSENGALRGTFSFISDNATGPSGRFLVCELNDTTCP